MKCEKCGLRKAEAMIRTKDVCKLCYDLLRRDNLKRQKSKISILNNLNILCETCEKKEGYLNLDIQTIYGLNKEAFCKECFQIKQSKRSNILN